jgi:hypothetical protein
MVDQEQLKELEGLYPGGRVINEGGYQFVYIHRLTLPAGCRPTEVEALLCPQSRDGYTTRLFLSAPVSGKGNNWTQHRIADRTWHTWSWQNVQAGQRLTQILLGHLEAFR